MSHEQTITIGGIDYIVESTDQSEMQKVSRTTEENIDDCGILEVNGVMFMRVDLIKKSK